MPTESTDSISVTTDSLATDSVAAESGSPSVAPVPWGRCAEIQAPTSPTDKALYTTRQPGWMEGVDVPTRAYNPADNAGVLSLLLALFVLIGFNMGHVRRLFRSLPQKLWSVRPRGNAFDENTTNETRTLALLVMLLCCFEGVLLYLWLGKPPEGHIFATVGLLSALMGAYYLFELAACWTVGYVFSDQARSRSWRRGLNASSAMLGLSLAVPALVGLFYPACTRAMLTVAASLFILSRIAFIAKGFRIFYTNFPSLLYFILYLCTLEIIPVIGLYISATEICKSL